MVPKIVKNVFTKEGTMKIPSRLADFWYSVKNEFCYGYYNLFCWILVAHCTNPGKATLASLCRWIPERVVYKALVRLLQSDRWNFMRVFQWHCQQIWKNLPRPQDGILYLIVDKTLVDKTGKKHPYNRKTMTGYGDEWRFGFYVVILVAQWGNYRFPIDFRLVTPKEHPGHKTPNELFVEMFENFTPPQWTKTMIVLADSEYASKKSLQAIIRRNGQSEETGVHCYFVMSFARTWKLDGEKTIGGNTKKLKDVVEYLPRFRYNKTWIPEIHGHRKVYWMYSRKIRLDTVGEVTMVISKKGRNTLPKKAKIFVTNIPDVCARDVSMLYRRRWYVEVLNHELKSACGLGDHQVTKKPERVQRSVAISMIAYLTILRFEAHRIKPGEHWSINTLKYFFAIKIFKEQSETKICLSHRKNVA